MGLLKKLKSLPKPVQTVGPLTNRFLLVDELKNKKMLETTNTGIFYTYLELLKVNKNPENLLKNLYVYGRSTGLLKEGEILQIRNKDDSELLATIVGDQIKLHYK